ncbi:MAG: DUF262 domain-containing HNH endonuclease family protein [Coriobacteriaceae bacterium]|nr:DUF262 domain-containing HNH endonuclease family protein [Coriobacteriaceae bacterium]
MSFDARQDVVGKLLNDSIYKIPRNQRTYVWKEQNWNDLFGDIELATKDDSVPHFIGSIVLKKEDREEGLDVYTIIDGQQRIITITLLLSAIMFEFKRRDMTLDARGTNKYLMAAGDKGQEIGIVTPENHVTLENIARGVIEIDSESAKKKTASAFAAEMCVSKKKDAQITKAFKHFASKLSSFDNDSLVLFRNAVVDMTYVDISATTEEDSYTIFEILNARGLELQANELLKNYIMRYIQPKESRDDAKRIWADIEKTIGDGMDEFLRHYAIHKFEFGKNKNDEVYKTIRDASDPNNVKSLLFDIQRKAEYYAHITSSAEGDIDHDVLRFFVSNRVRVFRPLLISLMHCKDREDLSEEEYLDALEFIHKFYIVYKTIGGMESNSLMGTIRKHAFAIKSDFKDISIAEMKKALKGKLPTLEAFCIGLQSLGWSHKWDFYSGSKNKDRCQLVLELLEESKSGLSMVPKFTIEHAFPDSENERNAVVGNLLPLEEALNKRCEDKPLPDKIEIYKSSCFATTRRFADRYPDGVFDIQARTEAIAKDIYTLFQV